MAGSHCELYGLFDCDLAVFEPFADMRQDLALPVVRAIELSQLSLAPLKGGEDVAQRIKLEALYKLHQFFFGII